MRATLNLGSEEAYDEEFEPCDVGFILEIDGGGHLEVNVYEGNADGDRALSFCGYDEDGHTIFRMEFPAQPSEQPVD